MPRARRIPKCELRPEWLQRPERAEVILDLPLCPATNNLYLNRPGIGRVKSPAYRSWIESAGLYGKIQRPGRMVGLADLRVHLCEFRGDTDGRVKALIACARAIGVIADDGGRYIRHVDIRRGEAPQGFVRLKFTRVGVEACTAEAPEAVS